MCEEFCKTSAENSTLRNKACIHLCILPLFNIYQYTSRCEYTYCTLWGMREKYLSFQLKLFCKFSIYYLTIYILLSALLLLGSSLTVSKHPQSLINWSHTLSCATWWGAAWVIVGSGQLAATLLAALGMCPGLSPLKYPSPYVVDICPMCRLASEGISHSPRDIDGLSKLPLGDHSCLLPLHWFPQLLSSFSCFSFYFFKFTFLLAKHQSQLLFSAHLVLLGVAFIHHGTQLSPHQHVPWSIP